MIAIAFAALVLAAGAQQLNNEPVIGIFTQPYGTTPLPAYFPASYVKYLESAGARVVCPAGRAPCEQKPQLQV